MVATATIMPIHVDTSASHLVLTEYHFPVSDLTKPAYEVQKYTSALMVENNRAYVLNDIGTGKTRCALWAYDYLRRKGQAGRMLVVAPLSNLHDPWGKEIRKEFYWYKFRILHGTINFRLRELGEVADIYIINHSGLIKLLPELIARTDIDVVCVDELGAFRNPTSKTLTLPLKELIHSKKRAWGLTGSPIPRAVTDVWAQCSCISPWTIPKRFSWFRDLLMERKSLFKWEPRPGAEEKALACMQPSVRYKLSEIKEMPERTYQYYEAAMSARQGQIYKEMSDNAVALVQNHTIDALNAGAVMSKLLQIALGYVYTREGNVITFDNTPRRQLIVNLIDSCAEKVILFAPFLHALNGLHTTLESNDIEHCIVHGGIKRSDRAEIFSDFQDTGRYKVLLAHPGCMSHGLTLTAATMIIWAGPITNLDTFYQANGRIYRLGQHFKTLIAMIGGSPRERKLYRHLAAKEQIQNRFLELIETQTAEDE